MRSRLRQFTRGYFDVVEPEGDRLRVVGWMFRLDGAFDELELRVNGSPVARQRTIELDRIGEAFPWIRHARRSGFSFHEPTPAETGSLEVVGLRGRRPAGSLSTVFSTRPRSKWPIPPTELMKRVSGSDNADFFRADGQRTFADLAAAVERHGGFDRLRRMLDWGCGCGRVTIHFLFDGRVPEVHGVDIDGEATQWCAGALPGGSFRQTGPYPPLPFGDGSFDLVVAYSVFTHLERDVQKSWLAEIRRVLSPGGLLLATVHGEFAAVFSFPEQTSPGIRGRMADLLGSRRIIPQGILDSTRDHALDDVAPEEYYRGTYQTRDYTLREWTRYLDVVEYREAGVCNYQDLVVLRKPPS